MRAGMLDERLDRAERLGQREEPRARDELERGVLVVREERHHAAEVAHLAARDLGLVGIQHLRRRRRARAASARSACAFAAVLAHAQRERLHAPQHEVAVERRRHRAHRVLQEAQLVGELGVVHRDEPADDVGVTAEVLRRRVHRRVGAERERLLEVRRRERVVDDDPRLALVRELRHRRDVDDREQRVGRRLDPHHAGLGLPRGLERARVAQIARRPRDPVALVHARDEPERAAVRVVRDDHVVAGIERAQDRVLGRETAREREAVPRALERRDARLQRGARGVAAARVLVAAVLADRVLRERRRQADRRNDRAGARRRVPGPRGWPRVSKPSAVRVLVMPALVRSEEAEHVGAGEHADRVAAVEHEHRRPGVEALDDARRPARRSRSSASAGP